LAHELPPDAKFLTIKECTNGGDGYKFIVEMM
jgi:hypothetical protein